MQKLFQKKLWLIFKVILLCFGLLYAKDVSKAEAKETDKSALSVDVLKDLKKIKENPSQFKLDFSRSYLLSKEDLFITLSASKLEIPISGKQVLLSVDDLKGDFSPCQSLTKEEGRLVCQTQTTKDGNFAVKFHSNSAFDHLLRFDVYFLDGRTGYVQHMQERLIPYYSKPLFYTSSIVLGGIFLCLLLMMIFKNFFPSLSPYFSLSLYYHVWFIKGMTRKAMMKLLGVFALLYILWGLPLGVEMLHFYLLAMVVVFFFFQPFFMKHAYFEEISFFACLILLWSLSAIYLVHYKDLISLAYGLTFLVIVFLISPILSLLFASLLSAHGLLWGGYYHLVFFMLLLAYAFFFLEKERGFLQKGWASLKEKLLKKKQ